MGAENPLAFGSNDMAVVVKTVLVSHFGVGAPPILVCFREDWEVHWGYDLDFDPWPHGFILVCLFPHNGLFLLLISLPHHTQKGPRGGSRVLGAAWMVMGPGRLNLGGPLCPPIFEAVTY